jgi:hypothetical protein
MSDWRHHWPVLYRRIKRYVAPGKLHFVMFPEKDKKETIHMHVLWSARFPGKKITRKKDKSVYYRSPWLADNCNSVGLGYIHDNRPLRSAMTAANYATKYITKTLGETEWPAYLRRARTSQHWPTRDFHEPKNEMEWSQCLTIETVHVLLRWWHERGYIDGLRGSSDCVPPFINKTGRHS